MLKFPFKRINQIFAFLFTVSVFLTSSFGQDAPRTDLGTSGTGTGSSSRVTKGKVIKVPVIKYKYVTPTTGTLVVTAEPNATIFVDPLDSQQDETPEGTVPRNERSFIFNNLKPGRYKVTVELNGYKDSEQITQIKANDVKTLDFFLSEIIYDITLNTNIIDGEVRYQKEGEPWQVTSMKNGSVHIKELQPGKYNIDIRPFEVGYLPFYGKFSLPGQTTFNLKLERRLSEEEFSAFWAGLDEWVAPNSWQTTRDNKLTAKGKGIASPRDQKYRYYADFHLTSEIKMSNGMGASFVLRALDESNYYLIRLFGGKADQPYILRGYIVKQGAVTPLGPVFPIDGVKKLIDDGKFFEISLRMIGNEIKIVIINSETGDQMPLGSYIDPQKTFQIGAVGLAVQEKEEFQVARFIVCSKNCP